MVLENSKFKSNFDDLNDDDLQKYIVSNFKFVIDELVIHLKNVGHLKLTLKKSCNSFNLFKASLQTSQKSSIVNISNSKNLRQLEMLRQFLYLSDHPAT